MSTRIIKKDGAYSVATEDGRLLIPPTSLEKAKQHKQVIDSLNRERDRLGLESSSTSEDIKKDKGPTTNQTTESLISEAPIIDYIKKSELDTDISIPLIHINFEVPDDFEIKEANGKNNLKDSWILVSRNLNTQEFDQPDKHSDVHIWIQKTINRQYNKDIWFYKYNLFSADLEPILLKGGNFICDYLYDFCKAIGGRNYYSIKAEIIDKENVMRSFYGFGQMEQGIIKTIEFMRTLSGYIDWADYYSKKEEPIKSPTLDKPKNSDQKSRHTGQFNPITSAKRRVPNYLKALGGGWDLSRAGKAFVITKPGLTEEQPDKQKTTNIDFVEEQFFSNISGDSRNMLLEVIIRNFEEYICNFPNLSIELITSKFKQNILTHNPEVPESIINEAFFIWHKLVIKAYVDYLEIHEEELTQQEIQSAKMNNQLKSTGEGVLNEETGEWEGLNYPEPPQREKESWVSVTKDLTTEELEIPYIDTNLVLWIHKSFDYKHCDGFWLFKYDLFKPDFHPMQLTEGNFICTRISDFCKSIGCGNYTTIKFDISDNSNRVYSFRGFAQMENGVIEAISFMRSLSRFSDWKDYDEMKALTKSLDRSDEELDKMIASELKDTGISLESNE